MPPQLKTVSVRDFRGIRSLDIDTSGKSIAVLGPNGSGKSSLVDAIDFLFSGQIRRLEGQGTGTYSFARHAPHIDGNIDTGTVEATISLDLATYRIRRTLRRPQALVVEDGVTLPQEISQFLSRCSQTGLHLLTRREILRFVLAEPSKRAQRVGALLQTASVDSVRLAVQGAARDSATAHGDLLRLQEAQRGAALRSVAPPAEDFNALLSRLNAHRHTLGAFPLSDLSTTAPLSNVAPPQALLASPLRSAPFRAQLADIRAWMIGRSPGLIDEGFVYARSLRELRSDLHANDAIKASDLVARGMAQMQGDQCPLCLTHWAIEELRELLQTRYDDASAARARFAAMDTSRNRLKAAFTSPLTALRTLQRDLERVGLSALQPIGAYLTALESLLDQLLCDPIGTDQASDSLLVRLREALPGEPASTAVDRLLADAAALPLIEGIQAAWDELNRAEVALRDLRATVEWTCPDFVDT